MKKIFKKILSYFDLTKNNRKKLYQKNKWVTFTSNHNTTYLEPNWSYPVFKEEGKWYYFKFGDKLIKYPKDYFEDYIYFSGDC